MTHKDQIQRHAYPPGCRAHPKVCTAPQLPLLRAHLAASRSRAGANATWRGTCHPSAPRTIPGISGGAAPAARQARPRALGSAQSSSDSGQNKPAANIWSMWRPGGEEPLPTMRGEAMKLGQGIINRSKRLNSLPGAGSGWGENSYSRHW